MKFGEPNKMSSNANNGFGSGIGRFSNRVKLKKIPQRGLGVAQLEKIRIEQLQNKDCSPPPIVSPTHSSSLTLPLLNHPSSQSSSSTPNFPSPPSTQPHTIVDTLYLNSISPLNHFNAGFHVGWPSVPRLDDTSHLSRMWHPCEVNGEDDNTQWENGLLLPNNITLPFQTNPIPPLPNVMTHEPQFLQVSDSLLMEHPSDRSIYRNLPSIWVEEEKMSSTKRPYPFSIDTPSLPSFQNKFQKIVNTQNESTRYGSTSFFNYDHDGSTLQETCILSSSNVNKNGEFLTLGPAASVNSPHPNHIWRDSLQRKTDENPTDKSTRSSSLNHARHENLVASARLESNDKNIDNFAINSRQGLNEFNQYKPFFSFFPTFKMQHETSAMNIFCNSKDHGEVGGIVDLNLKL